MSPRTAESNQLIRDTRREQILQAARKIFARQGFSATKISDIASAAGASYGLVGHYFGTKEEIYAAVVEVAFQGALKLLEETAIRPGSPWERLVYLCTEMLGGIKDFPEYVLLVNQVGSIASIPDEAKAAFREYSRRSLEIQIDLIRQAQAAGQVIDKDPVELVMAFTGMIQGLAIQTFESQYQAELWEHFPGADTILRILKP
jgi:AcrR family transcriptional regulator